MTSQGAFITVVGNVGADAEMEYTKGGTPKTDFSVAVSKSRPDGNGGWIDEGTDWYRCTVWGKAAERAAEQIRKGMKATVVGTLKAREWTSERTGKTNTSLEVRVDTVIAFQVDKSPVQQRVATGAGVDPEDSDDVPW